jgi:hypothetical protein
VPQLLSEIRQLFAKLFRQKQTFVDLNSTRDSLRALIYVAKLFLTLKRENGGEGLWVSRR